MFDNNFMFYNRPATVTRTIMRACKINLADLTITNISVNLNKEKNKNSTSFSQQKSNFKLRKTKKQEHHSQTPVYPYRLGKKA